MGEKRGYSDHHSGGRQGGGQHAHASKKHKANDFQKRNGHGGSNGKGGNGTNGKGYYAKGELVQEELSRFGDPSKCHPCKLAASEMQTGLIALLDHVVSEEADAEKGDASILKHARKLQKLLSSRASEKSVAISQNLDSKRPEKEPQVSVPPYLDRKLQKSKDLPPLPPISEPHLQEAVFTHRSANSQNPQQQQQAQGKSSPAGLPPMDYERLEFLGDAYIEVIASRLIYSRFPQLPPSSQSYFREQLVKNETLGQFSSAYGFDTRLHHGAHMKDSKNWTKVLADVFEAYIAALILSSPTTGFSSAETWLTQLWTPQLLDFKEKPVENSMAREELAKLIMGKGIKIQYKEEKDMVQVDGLQKYFMGAYLTGWGFMDEWLGSGVGQSKAQACVEAARDAVEGGREVVVEARRRKAEVYPPKEKEKEKEGEGGK